MKELISKIEEILEVENIDITMKFEDFDEWDSLAGISVIAMLSSDYNISITTKELKEFNSIESFCKKVLGA